MIAVAHLGGGALDRASQSATGRSSPARRRPRRGVAAPLGQPASEHVGGIAGLPDDRLDPLERLRRDVRAIVDHPRDGLRRDARPPRHVPDSRTFRLSHAVAFLLNRTCGWKGIESSLSGGFHLLTGPRAAASLLPLPFLTVTGNDNIVGQSRNGKLGVEQEPKASLRLVATGGPATAVWKRFGCSRRLAREAPTPRTRSDVTPVRTCSSSPSVNGAASRRLVYQVTTVTSGIRVDERPGVVPEEVWMVLLDVDGDGGEDPA